MKSADTPTALSELPAHVAATLWAAPSRHQTVSWTMPCKSRSSLRNLMHVSLVYLTAAGRTVHRYPGQVDQQYSQRCLRGCQVSITCDAQLEIIADMLGGLFDLWQIPIVTGHSGHHLAGQRACISVCLALQECVQEPPKTGCARVAGWGCSKKQTKCKPNTEAASINSNLCNCEIMFAATLLLYSTKKSQGPLKLPSAGRTAPSQQPECRPETACQVDSGILAISAHTDLASGEGAASPRSLQQAGLHQTRLTAGQRNTALSCSI